MFLNARFAAWLDVHWEFPVIVIERHRGRFESGIPRSRAGSRRINLTSEQNLFGYDLHQNLLLKKTQIFVFDAILLTEFFER